MAKTKIPKLIPLTLPIKERDKRIKANQLYLVQAFAIWAVGKFSTLWYGWNFDGVFDAGCQPEDITRIYEFHPEGD